MRPYSIAVTTAPATEPVSVATAKAHLRVEIDDDDTYIGALITAAREYAETYCKRKLISQTVEAKYPAWPDAGQGLWLPSPPLVSVTSVNYYATDGTETVLSTDVYGVDSSSEPGQVYLKPNQSWPALESGRELCIRVRYVAGYADAASVPDTITQGMLLLIGQWYQLRSDAETAQAHEVPNGAKMLFGINAVTWGC